MLSRLWMVALMLAVPADAAITVPTANTPYRATVATTMSTVGWPSGTDYLVLRPITITGYAEVNCTDGAAKSAAAYMTLTADTIVSVSVAHLGSGSLCLAGSGAGTIEIWPMRRGL